MACTPGLGTLTFGALTAEFYSPDGLNLGGKNIPAIDCTSDTATVKTYVPGNIPDFGEASGTILIEATSIAELKSIAGTSGTLTYTSELESGSGNETEATISGTAVWTVCDIVATENDVLKANVTFKWAGDVTYTNESA